MKITVVQPPYFVGDNPDEKIADFLINELQKAEKDSLIVLPEYSNAVLSAKVIDAYEYGTHTLFVAEVTEAVNLSNDPSVTYAYYQSNIKPKPQTAQTAAEKPEDEKKQGKWVCKICGYTHEGEELPSDFICPWCKHPAEDFEQVV